jgi:peptide-methionine (S)-S-oxide reductase
MHTRLALAGVLVMALAGCARAQQGDATMPEPKTELATFAGGCFWCIEAVFDQIPGVLRADSGYTGGRVANPTYEQVCDGTTGHAEAVEIAFDPARVSYEQLLGLFWEAHDPTQLNRQGNDVGTQYRSAIFYHSEAQKKAAEESIRKLAASGAHAGPIVTRLEPATTFYRAEKYHQEYYVNNRSQGYCRVIIRPKLEKLGLKP